MASSGSKRLMSVDVAKGFAITIIVLVHLLVLVPGGGNGSVSSALLEIVYAGLMLFFVYCGYFYKPGGDIRKNIKRRFVQLVGSYYTADWC